MKTNSQTIEDHQIRLTVEVEPEEVEKAQHRTARQLASRMKIPGFRPGKAPYDVILRYVGPEELRKETVYSMADDIYPQALENAGIDPYGAGALEDLKDEGESVNFTFRIPLQPETDAGDYRSIRIPFEAPSVTEKEIQDSIDEMRQNEAIIEPVERPAQEGDVVTVVLKARRVEHVEDKPDELLDENGAPFVILGKDDDKKEEWPYPGFSAELKGLSAGDEKTIPYTFKEDSPFESLRGVAATFEVKVEKVSSRSLPALDDDFAQSVGEFKTLDELRDDVRAKLEKNAQHEYEHLYDDLVIQSVLEKAKILYPPQMVDEEYENSLRRISMRLENLGMSLETYLKMRQEDKETFEKQMREKAEESVRTMLVIMEIAKKEKIDIDPHQLQHEAKDRLDQYRTQLSAADMRNVSSERLLANIANSLFMEKLTEKFWERMRQIARGEAAEEPAAESAAA